GHRAEASWSTAPAAGRTFAKAEEIGERLAAAAMKAIAAGRAIAPGVAPTTPAGASLGARLTRVQLPLAAREDPAALVARFEAQRATAASAGDHTSAALYTGLLEAARARLAAPAPEA